MIVHYCDLCGKVIGTVEHPNFQLHLEVHVGREDDCEPSYEVCGGCANIAKSEFEDVLSKLRIGDLVIEDLESAVQTAAKVVPPPPPWKPPAPWHATPPPNPPEDEGPAF